MTTRAKSAARKFLEELSGGPLTLAMAVKATREGEGLSQVDFARRLGVTRSYLCDLEKGRKPVSPSQAASFAKILGFSVEQYVRLAIQDQLLREGLRFEVELHARRPIRRKAA